MKSPAYLLLTLFLLQSCGPDIGAVRPAWDGSVRLSSSSAVAGITGLGLLSRGPAPGIKVISRRRKPPAGRYLPLSPDSLPLRPDDLSPPVRALDTSEADGERNNSR